MPEAFYARDGDLFVATELTRGPWDPGVQHASPTTALLGYAIEQLPEAGEFQVGRLTFEILRPVPIAPVRVSARVVRPGRRVQLVEAELADADGEVLMLARAWRLRRARVEIPPDAIPPANPLTPPTDGAPLDHEAFPTGQEHGYHTAMDYSFVSGSFTELGPATLWLRTRQPLVAGEEVTPLQRVLLVADVGSGLGSALDYWRFLFINVDLTVQLERMPEGEWVCIAAESLPQPEGLSTSESVLSDARGRLGRGLQTVMIRERSAVSDPA